MNENEGTKRGKKRRWRRRQLSSPAPAPAHDDGIVDRPGGGGADTIGRASSTSTADRVRSSHSSHSGGSRRNRHHRGHRDDGHRVAVAVADITKLQDDHGQQRQRRRDGARARRGEGVPADSGSVVAPGDPDDAPSLTSLKNATGRRERRRPGDGGAKASDPSSSHSNATSAAGGGGCAPSSRSGGIGGGSSSSAPPPTAATSLPPPFPEGPSLPLPPSNSFLRPPDDDDGDGGDGDPRYGPSFRAALETCHEGVAFDIPSPSASSALLGSGNGSSDSTVFPHARIRRALRRLNHHSSSSSSNNFFRTDVTQPMGPGTRCAPTKVTRCLLGERGTTYKYLGLRMFAHPWDGSGCGDETSDEVREALEEVRALNGTLEARAEEHLTDLDAKRRGRGAEPTRGRAKFDVTLINRMVDSDDLKAEPMSSSNGEGKGGRNSERCSVSWHADSSLEHYSTIAVYHTIFRDGEECEDRGGAGGYVDRKRGGNNDDSRNGNKDNACRCGRRWSVALRVAPHSEGPTAGKVHANPSAASPSLDGGGGDSGRPSSSSKWPAIAVSLPSGSAYYLLDDYNHHHQHAVLVSSSPPGGGSTSSSSVSNAGKKKRKRKKDGARVGDGDDGNNPSPAAATTAGVSFGPGGGNGPGPGVRYSSTHRLLRHGQNVEHILERCKSATSKFHKRGVKIWRSEQLLLTEIETEWIRQFYVQGRGHRDALWEAWREPICALLRYWSQLERRTGQVVELLTAAAEERCGAALTSRGKLGCIEASTGEEGEKDRRIEGAHAIPSSVATKARKEKKERERRRKAALAVANVLGRGHCGISADGVRSSSFPATDNVSVSRSCDASQVLYDPIASLLEERAEMRRLWGERESDRAFRRMEMDCQPLPPPLEFGKNMDDSKSSSADELGVSPLNGAPKYLGLMARHLRQCGRAYILCHASEFPFGAAGTTSWSTSACTEERTNKRAMVSGHHEPGKESVGASFEPVQADRTINRGSLPRQNKVDTNVKYIGGSIVNTQTRKRRKKRRY